MKRNAEQFTITDSSTAGYKYHVVLAAAVDTTTTLGARHAGDVMAQENNENPAQSGTHYQIIKNMEQLTHFVNWLPELTENECYYVELFCRKKYDQSMPQSKTYNLIRKVVTSPDGIINALMQMQIPVGCYRLRDVPVSQESLAVYISTNPRCRRKATFALIRTLLNKIEKGEELRPHSAALTEIHRAKSRSNFVTFDIDQDPEYNYNRAFMEVRELIGTEAISVIATRGGWHLLVEPSKVVSEVKNWHPKIQSLVMPDQVGDILSPIPGCAQGEHMPIMVVVNGEDR